MEGNRYYALFKHMKSGFAYHELIYDDKGKVVNTRFLDVNDTFEDYTGLKKEEVIGKYINEAIPFQYYEEEAGWLALCEKVAATGEGAEFQQYVPQMNRWFSVSVYCVEPGHVAVIFFNINQQKAVENALLESKSQLQAILDNIPHIAWLKNKEGMYLAVNEPFLQFIGKGTEEVIGKGDEALWSEKMARLLETLHKQLLDRKEKQVLEQSAFYKGKRLHFEVLVYPVFDQAQAIAGSTGLIQDITERRQEEIRRLEEQKKVDMLERLASLGTMAAGIAHEINQPLQALKTTIDGMLYWYERGKPLDMEQVVQKCRRVSEQGNRIANIVKRMRDFVNGSKSDKMEAVQLDQVVMQALEMVREQLRTHGILLREDLRAPKPVLGDRLRLEEIVINIVMNAVQALDSVEQSSKEIWLATRCEDNRIILEIGNNGPVISEQIIDKIYEPFVSSKIKENNMGLGLAIVHSIVNAHRGTIELLNTDQDVIFRIQFPAHEEM